jgi:hypothetical protein
MRILFVLRHPSYLRNFTSVVTSLSAAGHRVHILFDAQGPAGEDELVKRLHSEHANITWQFIEQERKDIRLPWQALANRMRYGCDYLRYLEKPFDNAHALRARAKGKAPEWIGRLGELYLGRFPPALAIALRFGPALEWSLWEHPLCDRFIDLFQPDVIMATPVVGLGSYQVDWFKAARRRGIPSILPVTSWDNLTNKGRLRVAPDKILVWNEGQKKEAVTLHGARAKDVIVCGAWTYDHWYEWRPTLAREEFLRMVGLEGAERYVLYVGSSPFIAPNETRFFQRYMDTLRADPATRGVAVLIRPHPQNALQWEAIDIGRWSQVSIFPKAGANPLSVSKQNQYFDSIWHSDAVFGINTSAQVEAGLIGRPVFTVTDPTFERTQSGTLHFHHLADPEVGLLHITASPAEHARQLAEVLALPSERRGGRSGSFAAYFVRPYGPGSAATPRFVETVESMQGMKARAPGFHSHLGLAIRSLILRRLTSVKLKRRSKGTLTSVQLRSDEGR